jgi:hypothetical protein
MTLKGPDTMTPQTFTLDFFAGAAGDVPFRAIVTMNEDARTLVQFYDRRAPTFGPNGQPVSRYHIVTLLDHGAESGGLNLDGGVDNWTIGGDVWPFVFEWLERAAGFRKARRATGGQS